MALDFKELIWYSVLNKILFALVILSSNKLANIFMTTALILSSSGPDPVQVHSRSILIHSDLFQFKI